MWYNFKKQTKEARMEKIASFNVNHIGLNPGVYVSRRDDVNGSALTTFDLRFTRPNIEPAMETAPIHAIEHLGATFLRNSKQWSDQVIYFGPMGCRTGFYLILVGHLESEGIIDLLKDMCTFIVDFEGDIPGASERDCGNYLDLNLTTGKYHTADYLNKVLCNLTKENTVYPV